MAKPRGLQSKVSAMMECVTYRGAVYPWHCDHMGHMNVMWYVGKFDEATWNLMARIGIAPTLLRDEPVGMAAVDQHLTYRRELLAGDVVDIASRILEIGEKSIRFRHEMRNAESGELAATCEITAVHLDRAARKSRPFSAAIQAAAKAFIAQQSAN
jgi:acyl-CoA thioester hydrolase